jgi:hypothetical protein
MAGKGGLLRGRPFLPSSELHDDVAVEARAQDVFAQQAGFTRLLQRGIETAQWQVKFTTDVDEGVAHTQRVTRQQHAFKQLVGCVFKNPAVLEGAGLAFVGVAAQVDDGALLVDEAPLHARGKARATAPLQARGGHFLFNVGRLQRRQRLGEAAVATALTVGGQRVAAVGDGVAKEDLCAALHGRLRKMASAFAASRFS